MPYRVPPVYMTAPVVVVPSVVVKYVQPAPLVEYVACAVIYGTLPPVGEYVVQQSPLRHLPLWSCTSPLSFLAYAAQFFFLMTALATVVTQFEATVPIVSFAHFGVDTHIVL